MSWIFSTFTSSKEFITMSQKEAIKLFEDKKVRAVWDDEKEEWYFSIVDVMAVLTESPNPQTYWRVLKKRLKDE
jgi:prophage antirepressor-like protein